MSDTLSILTHSTNLQAKVWQKDGKVIPSAEGKHFALKTRTVQNIFELSATLADLAKKPQSSLIRGKYAGDDAARKEKDYKEGKYLRRTL